MVEMEREKFNVINGVEEAVQAAAVGSSELPSLRHEGERLKVERDVEQLRAELAALRAPKPPWWRQGSIVATMTAIIAAVIPVTTAVQGHYQKVRELALQASKQDHEIRISYLDRLDKPGAKLRTLRFVLATTVDPALRRWAEAEKREVESEIADLNQQIAAIDAQLAKDLPPTTSASVFTKPGAGAPTPVDSEEERERQRLRDRRELLHRHLQSSTAPNSTAPRAGSGASRDLLDDLRP
jgi:hypothetical protein